MLAKQSQIATLSLFLVINIGYQILSDQKSANSLISITNTDEAPIPHLAYRTRIKEINEPQTHHIQVLLV